MGCPCALNQADYAFLSAIINHQRSIYLDELLEELQLKHNVQTTLSTLSHTLKQLGVTHKMVSACAYEWNQLLWALYMNQIAEEVPDMNMLMFIDEAAKNECMCMVFRRFGCSKWGIHCITQRCFIHGTHYSIIPVLTLNEIIAHDIVEGPVDTEQFVKFFKDQVVSSRASLY